MNKDIEKCDPCLSGLKRKEETETLVPLQYDCINCRRAQTEKSRAQRKKQLLLTMADPKG